MYAYMFVCLREHPVCLIGSFNPHPKCAHEMANISDRTYSPLPLTNSHGVIQAKTHLHLTPRGEDRTSPWFQCASRMLCRPGQGSGPPGYWNWASAQRFHRNMAKPCRVRPVKMQRYIYLTDFVSLALTGLLSGGQARDRYMLD